MHMPCATYPYKAVHHVRRLQALSQAHCLNHITFHTSGYFARFSCAKDVMPQFSGLGVPVYSSPVLSPRGFEGQAD